jgi:hypothetical protein
MVPSQSLSRPLQARARGMFTWRQVVVHAGRRPARPAAQMPRWPATLQRWPPPMQPKMSLPPPRI